ncbi:MAG: stimulus-sensing domain-containing protein [Rhodospirillales bacterium]|nr:stimulus-sensing domain-containing protein [Rhodospirillales bacterium]
MPDSGVLVTGEPPARQRQPRRRLTSPLLRRILLVNALPLGLLLAALLYLDQYQNGLLVAEVGTLREEARIYAAALGQSAVLLDAKGQPHLDAQLAQPLLRRLTAPTPSAQAKVYAPDGTVIANSTLRDSTGGAVEAQPLPPPVHRSQLLGAIGRLYDWALSIMPHGGGAPSLQSGPGTGGPDWQPNVKEEIRLSGSDSSREMPPYIRRTQDNRLLITVAEPVERGTRTVGIVLLTREAREIDNSLLAVRLSILGLFSTALVFSLLLSWYLSQTIARPILRLAQAADAMREGSGRTGTVPSGLLARSDEVGELAHALSDSARALWTRMDATERFAADVAHEIKNPLSSIRSAIETLTRIEDPEQQRRLLSIIAEDVRRLDRLISDISDASRIDAEISRASAVAVPVRPILETLVELDEATRRPGAPRLELARANESVAVRAIEDRLVQVLRNLIGNAQSFSPPDGRIRLHAQSVGRSAEITVEDHGPGIPEGKLEQIFSRFYSERPQGERFGQHSGLGLSISRQIIEALHGTIAAENLRDAQGRIVGARFTIRLPLA